MEGFELLHNKSGQELISVLRDGEDLLLRFSDETWLRVGYRCYSDDSNLFIKEKKD